MASCSQGGITQCSWFSPPGCGWFLRTGEGEEEGEEEGEGGGGGGGGVGGERHLAVPLAVCEERCH